jgi:hypothetical protein
MLNIQLKSYQEYLAESRVQCPEGKTGLMFEVAWNLEVGTPVQDHLVSLKQ